MMASMSSSDCRGCIAARIRTKHNTASVVIARAANAGALAEIARRNGGDEALVAAAVLRGTPDRPAGLDVSVRRYRAEWTALMDAGASARRAIS